MNMPFRRKETERDVAVRLSSGALYEETEQRIADKIINGIASFVFIAAQLALIVYWVEHSGVGHLKDPYPYILLNLVLSLMAAFNAPLIGLSSKRTEYWATRRHEDQMALLRNIHAHIAPDEALEDGES